MEFLFLSLFCGSCKAVPVPIKNAPVSCREQIRIVPYQTVLGILRSIAHKLRFVAYCDEASTMEYIEKAHGSLSHTNKFPPVHFLWPGKREEE